MYVLRLIRQLCLYLQVSPSQHSSVDLTDRQKVVIIVTAIVTLLAIIVVTIRIRSRLKSRKLLGMDDFWIVLAVVRQNLAGYGKAELLCADLTEINFFFHD